MKHHAAAPDPALSEALFQFEDCLKRNGELTPDRRRDLREIQRLALAAERQQREREIEGISRGLGNTVSRVSWSARRITSGGRERRARPARRRVTRASRGSP